MYQTPIFQNAESENAVLWMLIFIITLTDASNAEYGLIVPINPMQALAVEAEARNLLRQTNK